MKIESKIPAAVALLTAPLAAHAETIPHIDAYFALGGGFVGGFLGALLACWLCKRMGSGRGDSDPKKR